MIQTTATVERTTARRKFGGYKPEAPKTVRKLKVKESSMPKIYDAWMGYKYGINSRENSDDALSLLKHLRIRASDIEEFSRSLPKLDDDIDGTRLGLFFNLMINCCEDEKITIDTSGHYVALAYFGFRNTKHLVINGFGGYYLGMEMQSGLIEVNGNCNDYVGDKMTGGEIHINGWYGGLGCVKGGKIYHEGRLIVDK